MTKALLAAGAFPVFAGIFILPLIYPNRTTTLVAPAEPGRLSIFLQVLHAISIAVLSELSKFVPQMIVTES
jgi:hypothetical protein